MAPLPASESIPCPDPGCPAVALVVDRWSWPSTNGPVEHVKTQCPNGHVFTPTTDSLMAELVPDAARVARPGGRLASGGRASRKPPGPFTAR